MNTCFAMDTTLLQATILEQQITQFILEKEYKNELGVPVNEEADDDKNALQKAGTWIKDKIDKFIALIKRWAGIIGNFLTKTVPGWISKVITGLLVLLHIRQKTEKVDPTKIESKNKETVKTACDQANKANRVIVAAKEEKKNKVVAAPKISGFKDNDGTLSQNKSEESQDTAATVQPEIVEKAEKVKDEAIKKLEEVKEKSDSPAEKQEIEKTIKNIEAEKQVELAEEKLDYLEGDMIDYDLYCKYCRISDISFSLVATRVNSDNSQIMRYLNKLLNKSDSELKSYDKHFLRVHGDEDNNGLSNDRLKIVIDGRKGKDYGYGLSYTECKKDIGFSIDKLQGSNKKQILKKDIISQRVKSVSDTYRKDQANKLIKSCKELVNTLEKMKSLPNIDQKLWQEAMHITNEYLRDSVFLANDDVKIQSIFLKSARNFLITAKPCKG